MSETMSVGELKEALNEIPDSYRIRTRPKNAHLSDDEIQWQLNFSGVVKKIKIVDSQKTVMLIRDFE